MMSDRLGQIDASTKYPFDTQNRVFQELITTAVDTEWGKTYHYSDIVSQEKYAKGVPLQDYNTLKGYIKKMMDGEANVLWPGLIQWYAKSSGTTDDRCKFIPVSRDALQNCHFKAGKDLYALFYKEFPEANVVDGKTLVLGGSHQLHTVSSALNIRYGDLSAVLMQNSPFWAEAKRVPMLSVALMDNWEEKITLMAESTINQSITNILGVPTWTVILIKKLFEISGKNNLIDIWPNLQLYIHGGVSFEPYRGLFKNLIDSNQMHYQETYNASEGFFALQDDFARDDMMLLLDYGIYYEFILAEQFGKENAEVIPLEGVETGKNYAIIITTNSGLWRYALGDTVRFTETNPYRIKVSGRTRFFINAFGEELIVENAEKALAVTTSETKSHINDYTAAPIYLSESGKGAHEWFIEFDNEPSDRNHFNKLFDDQLRLLNSDYDAKRLKDMALREPVIHYLPKGTFYEWMKYKGKLGGQNKVPRLSNDRIFADDLLKFINK